MVWSTVERTSKGYLLHANDTERQFSTPYTPQQNGVAKRLNRTLVEMASCMLQKSGLPESFCAETVSAAGTDILHEA